MLHYNQLIDTIIITKEHIPEIYMTFDTKLTDSIINSRIATTTRALTNSTLHKRDMAIGVAASVFITAGAVAGIATAMIFCPPVGLSALALGLTFGILGGAGSLSLLGIVHCSVRLHCDKFRINSCKAEINKITGGATRKDLDCLDKARRQVGRYNLAEDIVAPWRPLKRRWKLFTKNPQVATGDNTKNDISPQ